MATYLLDTSVIIDAIHDKKRRRPNVGLRPPEEAEDH